MRIFLTIIIVSLCQTVFSQNLALIDSLSKIYRAQTDTTRILVLAEIGKEYHRFNPDTAILLAQQAVNMAEKISFTKGKARGLNIMGLGYYIKADFSKALGLYQEAFPLFLASGDKQGYGLALNNAGLIYYYQNDLKKALEYYLQAVEFHLASRNRNGQALTLNNIGLCYEGLGDNAQALKYYLEALQLYQSLGNEFGIGQSLTNIGYVYSSDRDYPKALRFLRQALQSQQKTKDISTMSSSLLAMAQIHKHMHSYDSSVHYAQRALDLAKSINGLYDAREAIHLLYEVSKERGILKDALFYFEEYKVYNDTIFNIEKGKAIANLETKIELERKQEQLDVLESEKDLQKKVSLAIAIALVIAIASGLLIYRSRKKLALAYVRLEDANKELASAKAAIEAQTAVLERSNQTKDKIFSIVSHDLKSPLHSLKALLSMFNSGEVSREEFLAYIGMVQTKVNHASDIAEELLLWSRGQLNEMRIKPESVKLGIVMEEVVDQFKQTASEKGIEIRMDKVDLTVMADLNMLKTVLRNLLANAIKFTSNGGWVTITTQSDNKQITVTVTDTGVGISSENLEKLRQEQSFTTPGTNREPGTGIGLGLCRDFVRKWGGHFEADSELGKGTTFYFTLPIS